MDTFSAAVPQISKVHTSIEIAESGYSTNMKHTIERDLEPNAIAKFKP